MKKDNAKSTIILWSIILSIFLIVVLVKKISYISEKPEREAAFEVYKDLLSHGFSEYEFYSSCTVGESSLKVCLDAHMLACMDDENFRNASKGIINTVEMSAINSHYLEYTAIELEIYDTAGSYINSRKFKRVKK